MVALEWMDVEPLIGCKVSDYIIQHKRVEDPSEAEVYTGRKMIIQVLDSVLMFQLQIEENGLCSNNSTSAINKVTGVNNSVCLHLRLDPGFPCRENK